MKIHLLDIDIAILIEHLEAREIKVDTLLIDHIHKLNSRLKVKDGDESSGSPPSPPAHPKTVNKGR